MSSSGRPKNFSKSATRFGLPRTLPRKTARGSLSAKRSRSRTKTKCRTLLSASRTAFAFALAAPRSSAIGRDFTIEGAGGTAVTSPGTWSQRRSRGNHRSHSRVSK